MCQDKGPDISGLYKLYPGDSLSLSCTQDGKQEAFLYNFLDRSTRRDRSPYGSCCKSRMVMAGKDL